MPTLFIDGQKITISADATILAAATRLGIRIPTLCHSPDGEPQTSCLVCVVKILGGDGRPDRIVPSCATRVEEGMRVESESASVHELRRTALELLLSEHQGDCVGPCETSCPAHLNIPAMLRAVVEGDLVMAIQTVRQRIPIPATLGRICSAPCEKGCRRVPAGGAVSICAVKQFVGDAAISWKQEQNQIPVTLAPDTGCRVAVIGAGPTGLSAAWYLRLAGHQVTLYERASHPGGRLLEWPDAQLPITVLQQEIEEILRLGIEFQPHENIDAIAFERIQSTYDAVLIAVGERGLEAVMAWGITCGNMGIPVDRTEWQVNGKPHVFAGGGVTRKKPFVVRSVGDGREAAEAISRFLRTSVFRDSVPKTSIFEHPINADPCGQYSCKRSPLTPSQLLEMVSQVSPESRSNPSESASGFTPEEAVTAARRCLRCDCVSRNDCRLRAIAAEYGAKPSRFVGGGMRKVASILPQFFQSRAPATGELRNYSFEPAKCIDCGLCVQISTAFAQQQHLFETPDATCSDAASPYIPAGPIGVTFAERGFQVQIRPPFHRSLEAAFAGCAEVCAAHCPTAGLAIRLSAKE